ncbi:hypothetical protein [Streptomyces tsukubensis]|uniref:Uncharacterized protein n=1 Tax=Streptomyces tsukubensis TaxID=83656 RepID=A0A1V4AC48_9ACTN|nr:hypothetical protein [Streptomyces tsukubensis]OON81112.1 hypothetical protein B1H18_09945 [Streptomyces tsukubensis]QFR94947.1 hypothetical protein GBW32_20330 [Streptomyces tsukubensis]
MGKLTQQEEDATRKGINALEQAFAGVQRSRQELENTKNNVGMGGDVGRNYIGLLDKWDDQAEIISKNLREMINELNNTLQQSGLTRGSANDAVNTAYHKSESIFNALAG